MSSYTFTFVLDRPPTDKELDRVLSMGNDDVLFGTEGGLPVVVFDREAATMADAIASAVHVIDSTDLTALRVLDEDLMTLADIADRINQSRESIRRYATGERGPGGFPPPVNPAREGTAFFRWSEVAPWLRDHLRLDVQDSDSALVVANLVLQARRHRYDVEHISALTDLLAA